MASVDSKQLRQDITDILKGADLSSLSGKKVRRQLEEKYETDLSERKKEVDELMMAVLDEIQNGNDAASDAESSASEEVEDREPVAKKSKIAQKKDNSDKDDSGSDVDDEELAKQLQDEENKGGRRTRGARTPQAKNSKKKKVKDPSQKKPPKLCFISPTLAAIVGSNQMARSEVVKKMWEIIKARNLQDPKSRNFMICDDELFTVFGRRRVKTFGMMKYLSNHIFRSEQDFEDSTF